MTDTSKLRETPETNAAEKQFRSDNGHQGLVFASDMRKLERQRDELAEALQVMLWATALFEDGLDECDGQEYDAASNALTTAELNAKSILAKIEGERK